MLKLFEGILAGVLIVVAIIVLSGCGPAPTPEVVTVVETVEVPGPVEIQTQIVEVPMTVVVTGTPESTVTPEGLSPFLSGSGPYSPPDDVMSMDLQYDWQYSLTELNVDLQTECANLAAGGWSDAIAGQATQVRFCPAECGSGFSDTDVLVTLSYTNGQRADTKWDLFPQQLVEYQKNGAPAPQYSSYRAFTVKSDDSGYSYDGLYCQAGTPVMTLHMRPTP